MFTYTPMMKNWKKIFQNVQQLSLDHEYVWLFFFTQVSVFQLLSNISLLEAEIKHI